jgi:hypothetical protein
MVGRCCGALLHTCATYPPLSGFVYSGAAAEAVCIECNVPLLQASKPVSSFGCIAFSMLKASPRLMNAGLLVSKLSLDAE